LTHFSVSQKVSQTLLLRLSAVLRNAVVMCRPLITPYNCWYKTTWPGFQPSLPPGLVAAPCLTSLPPEGPHVLVPAACSRLCLALPWPRRRRCGAGTLAPTAPAITRGLPASWRSAARSRRRRGGVRSCPSVDICSRHYACRGKSARSCLAVLAWAGASFGGSAPPNPCQAAAECCSIGLLLTGLCAAVSPAGPVLPQRQPAVLLGRLAGVLLSVRPLAAASGCRLLRRFSSSSRSAR
jgi:hypothetical protein